MPVRDDDCIASEYEIEIVSMLRGIVLRPRYVLGVPQACIFNIAHKDAIPIVHDSVAMLYRPMLVDTFQISHS